MMAGVSAVRRSPHLQADAWGSRSTIRVETPCFSAATASESASVVLPVPPFWAMSAIVCMSTRLEVGIVGTSILRHVDSSTRGQVEQSAGRRPDIMERRHVALSEWRHVELPTRRRVARQTCTRVESSGRRNVVLSYCTFIYSSTRRCAGMSESSRGQQGGILTSASCRGVDMSPLQRIKPSTRRVSDASTRCVNRAAELIPNSSCNA